MAETHAEVAEGIKIGWEVSLALGSYAAVLAGVRKAKEMLSSCNEVIDEINAGLPPGTVVVTHTPNSKKVESPSRGGYAKIYKVEAGGLIESGLICTVGQSYPFLGNRCIVIDECPVIVNDDVGYGIETKHALSLLDTVQDGKHNAGECPEVSQFENNLLPLLRQVMPGSQMAFDCTGA